MTRSVIDRLAGSERGAAAATAALALFALVGVGGLAFDYARLMALDTELQSAADQAALAAATQLDGQAGACTRAIAAARSMIANQTHFANDGDASGLTVGIDAASGCGAGAGRSIKFYSSYTNDTTNTEATTDGAARFVGVSVATRKAVYALTPIIGMFNSGNLSGIAVAGLGAAICKVPPVMMCNPDEGSDPTFTTANYIGKGLKLASVGNGNGAWAPGNFGYLDTGSPTSNPNVELRQALGWTTAPGDCLGLDGVNTRTGSGTIVTQALNTRFDMYERSNTGNGNNASCPTGGVCPASINSLKDVVSKGAPNAANKCGFANNEWELASPEYLPPSASAWDVAALPAGTRPAAIGHPRDMCHAVSTAGSCAGAGGKLGDGNWDRDAYFFINYGWNAATWKANVQTGINPVPDPAITPLTRYRLYQWEIANRGAVVGGITVLGPRVRSGSGPNAVTSFGTPVCSSLQGYGTGLVPGGTTVDRRRISAAVINCTAQSVNGGGGGPYTVQKWIEMFLVEPSLNRTRTDANDVYVEVIGETTPGAAATAGQVVRRDKPYLVE